MPGTSLQRLDSISAPSSRSNVGLVSVLGTCLPCQSPLCWVIVGAL